MGKHAQIEPGRMVVNVFVATSRRGLSEPLRGQEWRKDLLTLVVSDLHKATDVTRPPLPEIWDDGARSERASSVRGGPDRNAWKTRDCSRKR